MRIVAASVIEMSRVPFDSISINKIIRDAEISRGSFYQYFENKNDLIKYILSDFKVLVQNCFRENLVKSGGEIFVLAEALYDDVIRFGENEKKRKIIGNFFLGMKISRKNRTDFWDMFGVNSKLLYNILEPYLEKNRLISIEPEFVDCIFEAIFLFMAQSFADVFSDYENAEFYKREFHTHLDIIRRGSTVN